MKERILQFINYKGISNREFEIKCGMSNGYINSMRKGLGTLKIEQVLKQYPELNRNWLMTGEGEMLRGVTQAIGDNSSHNTQSIGAQCSSCPITAQLVEKDRQIAKLQDTIDKLMEKI